ncbi:hypothetical protein ACFPYI_12055 [Halomarina salina]|uniref:Uncharacterized protein n=1 Tax=Halomarina salina TaxID=1872699 RepID=A0ABD5RP91_9EURY|nr:hypothetical protein [Halomarina salina]
MMKAKDLIFWIPIVTFTIVILILGWTGYQLFLQGETAGTRDIVSISSSVATVFLVLLTIWQAYRTRKMFDEEYQRDKEKFDEQYERDKELFEREYERNIELFERKNKAEQIERELESLARADLLVKALKAKYLHSKNRATRNILDGVEYRMIHESDAGDVKGLLEDLREQSMSLRRVEDGIYFLNYLCSSFEVYEKGIPLMNDDVKLAIDKLETQISVRSDSLVKEQELLREE